MRSPRCSIFSEDGRSGEEEEEEEDACLKCTSVGLGLGPSFPASRVCLRVRGLMPRNKGVVAVVVKLNSHASLARGAGSRYRNQLKNDPQVA